MTVAEASAVNALVRALVGRGPYTDESVPTEDQLLEAAEHLVDRAHRRLLAGYNPGRVRELWAVRRERLREAADLRATVSQIRRAVGLPEGSTTDEIADEVERLAERVARLDDYGGR